MLHLILCSIVMQNIQIFYGGPVKFVVTCSVWIWEMKVERTGEVPQSIEDIHFKDGMLGNFVSVDMKDYALQLNRNPLLLFSTELCKILEQLFFRIILGGCFWKENRVGERRTVTIAVSGFHFFTGSYS